MTGATVSVIIVTRDRPRHLARCLAGLAQQRYPAMEIIIVSDPAGIAAAGEYLGRIKVVPFDQPNISAARNAGLAVAAGEIVAFIDDDAVPEPNWLCFLTEPVADGRAVAAGGYVIGRNGISYQWTARSVTPEGVCLPIAHKGDGVLVGKALKTEGTNMAFDRAMLLEMGGFDPAFEFYLDETDLDMRLARAGHPVAIVPSAVVHHGFAPSDRRGADRVPKSLFHIGRSLAIYLRRHLPPQRHADAKAAERDHQTRRMRDLMKRQLVDTIDVRELLRSFERGLSAGESANLSDLAPLAPATDAFLPFPTNPDAGHVAILCRWHSARRNMDTAVQARKEGKVVSVYDLSLTAFFHRVTFTDDGIWLQKGGVFGKSDRRDPVFRFWTFARRVAHETGRTAMVRALTCGKIAKTLEKPSQ